MPDYRLFRLDGAGSLLGPSRKITVDSDQAAIEHARRTLDGAVIEIWAGPRRIATISTDEDQQRI